MPHDLHLAASRAPRFYWICNNKTFAISCVLCAGSQSELEMETGRHSIEATVLIVGFMRAPLVPFLPMLNNLSPRQLLNQPLSLLSCHKEAQASVRTPRRSHTNASVHAQSVYNQMERKKERDLLSNFCFLRCKDPYASCFFRVQPLNSVILINKTRSFKLI